MNIRQRHKIKFIVIVLLTVVLTTFYYLHETIPKPIRAFTALLGTPTSIASGLSYYLKLGIPVYESPIAVIISNSIASIIVVILADKLLKWTRKRRMNIKVNRNATDK